MKLHKKLIILPELPGRSKWVSLISKHTAALGLPALSHYGLTHAWARTDSFTLKAKMLPASPVFETQQFHGCVSGSRNACLLATGDGQP